jgi:hypothetical protein
VDGRYGIPLNPKHTFAQLLVRFEFAGINILPMIMKVNKVVYLGKTNLTKH